MFIRGEGREERAVLEHLEAESFEGHRRQGWIQRSDKILVKPLRLLNLKAKQGDILEVFLREVYEESRTQIVQP